MKRLLITGTRYGWDREQLREALKNAYYELITSPGEPVLLVHGDAPGVDTEAAEIWQAMELPVEAHPALWKVHGKAAGPIRNAEMVDLGADLCLAFISPSSIGTRHCVGLAEAAGIPVEAFYSE